MAPLRMSAAGSVVSNECVTPFGLPVVPDVNAIRIDRKSTRLNSSHGYISYAGFCLKKKQAPRDSFMGLHEARSATDLGGVPEGKSEGRAPVRVLGRRTGRRRGTDSLPRRGTG